MEKGLRVIFLGPTGVDKRNIADRLNEWCSENLSHSFTIIDFEKDYLTNISKGGRPLASFLAEPVRDQQAKWRQAWDYLCGDGLTNKSSENFILVMHGTIVRGNYGVRCVCDLDRLKAFKANIVVTLIDDVYNLWWRTESRAFGEYSRGRPTLEQLIMARRTEQVLGDMISFQGKYPVRHLVLPTAHPTEILARYIFTAKRVVYLAFPISRPEEMLERNNNKEGIEGVNSFLKAMYKYQAECFDTVFINPLAIDELPLLKCLEDEDTKSAIKEGDKKVETVLFDLSRTWDLTEFWDTEHCLSKGPPESKFRKPFLKEELENAAGLIRTDVGWRDFRLVMQADVLVAFSPVMARDKLSRGVEAEILEAISQSKHVYIYQNPKFDPQKKFLDWLGDPGTMSENIKQQWIMPVDSLEELIERLRSL